MPDEGRYERLQEPGAAQDRLVLDLGGDEVIATGALGQHHADERCVVGLGSAAGERDFGELGPEGLGERVAGTLEKGDQTEVRFAHLGLLPQFECFGVCSNAWGSLMASSLPSLIATGTGHPYK